MESRRNPNKSNKNPPESTNEEESNAPGNRRPSILGPSISPPIREPVESSAIRERSVPLSIRDRPSIQESSKPPIRDPSIPASIPTTPREPPLLVLEPNNGKCKNCVQNFMKYVYNSNKGTYCERTCRSWIEIIGYSLLYLLFLTTYTLVFLYASLCIIKAKGFSELETEHQNMQRLMVHESKSEVGLSATPTAAQDKGGNPIIWYRSNHSSDFGKYISALDSLMLSRRSTPELIKSLGPCGQSPYGYDEKPCVVVRINKQLNWVGIPLSPNTTMTVPAEVMSWVKSGRQMLWLHCTGHHPYDQEHLGKVSYYPHPPGFDPKEFPLDVNKSSPLVAVQFSNFTRGVSIAVTCKLWHEYGPSSVDFLLYVLSHKKSNVEPPQ